MFSTKKFQLERETYASFEIKKNVLRVILRSQQLKPYCKEYTRTHFGKTLSRRTGVSFKSRCLLSGRSRSFYRFARLSRLFLRENAYIGMIPGLRKSYW